MSWEIKRIKDVALVTAGQSPEGIYYNDQGEGLPFYQGKKEFTAKYIAEAKVWTTKITKIAEADDVLMSVRAPVGPVNFATQQCCIGRGLASIRVTEKFNKDFLFLFFKHIENELTGNTGAVFNSINKSQIENISIPIPTLSEQQQIVEKLDTAFDLIDRAKANIEKNIQNAKELFQSKLNQVFSEKGEGWEEKIMQDLCEKITDGTHQTPTYFDSGYIFLSSRNVTSGKIDWDNIKYIDEKQHKELHKRVSPRRGDILLAKNGTTGVAAMVDKDVVFDIYVSLAWIRSKGEIAPEYLLYFINSPIAKKQFNSRLKGIGVPNLHLKEIKEVRVNYPSSLETQKQIVKHLDQLSAQTEFLRQKYQQKLANLEELKKSILEKAFKGELI